MRHSRFRRGWTIVLASLLTAMPALGAVAHGEAHHHAAEHGAPSASLAGIAADEHGHEAHAHARVDAPNKPRSDLPVVGVPVAPDVGPPAIERVANAPAVSQQETPPPWRQLRAASPRAPPHA